MPAYPFGNYIKLAQYLNWVETQGFKMTCGTLDFETLIRLTHPDGRFHIFVGIDQTDNMLPLEVRRADRALSISSPFYLEFEDIDLDSVD
jgi:hypothetical protein